MASNTTNETLVGMGVNKVASDSVLEDMVTNDQIEELSVYMTPDETEGFISLPIGTIFPSAIPQTSSAFHLLDGSTISKTGIYADFATLLSDLVTAGYNISCTQAQFDSDVSTYGQCGKFVIDTDTIRLPKITKFIEGLSSITNIGTSFQAGLPNITGDSGNNIGNHQVQNTGSGALYYIKGGTGGIGGSGYYGHIYMDASRSNEIYGRSNTVQPQSTAYPYYIVLANSYKTDIQVDIDEVASDLALKSDKNLVASVTTTSASNTITISGLNGIVADGGVYDIFINGNTSGYSHQWVYLSDTDVGNCITHTSSSIYAERQNNAIGTLADYGSGIHCVLYKPSTSSHGIRVFSSLAYNSSSHWAVTGTGLYTGNGKSFTFRLNGSALFPVGSVVKIYKRS